MRARRLGETLRAVRGSIRRSELPQTLVSVATDPAPSSTGPGAAAVITDLPAAASDARSPVPEMVISATGLRMTFGDLEAVRGIDVEVQRGEVFAFLGPNGAGKTTTVEILEGYLKRSAGEVSVLGVDPEHADSNWRERVGVVLQESAVEPDLTVTECLDLYGGCYGAPRPVDEIIELVGLKEKADVRGGALSGGQRRRLDVALALVGDPELVFLDEPTTGFDPSARRAAWEMIAGLQELGKTIFLTTHYMDEAEHLADRICVLASGEIVGEGTPQNLGGRESAPSEISFTLPSGLVRSDLPAALLPAVAAVNHDRIELRSDAPVDALFTLCAWAREHGRGLPDLQVHRPTLEDVYLRLTESLG
jgi:ABC-2 type transport system ATP-binding protein